MKTRKMRFMISIFVLCFVLATLLAACGEVKPEHTHDLSNGYEKDTENHWQTCSGCDEKVGLEAHKWSEWVTTDDEGGSVSSRYCTVCGEIQRQTNEEGGNNNDNNDGNNNGNEGDKTDTTKMSYYWGVSVYDEDLIAKTEYDENGRISATHHYLACVEMTYSYGALCEEMREIYEYDESGKLTRIKIYEDYVGSMFGVFGAYTKPELIAEYGFVYGSDGKMTKIEQYYEGKLDDETYMLCVYDADGELERLDTYESYSSSWEIAVSFFLENGKIVKVTEDGHTSELIYGEDGNVTSVKGDALWQNTRYVYDANGNPTEITYGVGGEDESSIFYTYNADGTVKETQMTNDSTCRAEFTYDSEKRPTLITVSDTVNGKELTLFVLSTEFDGNSLLISFEYNTYNPENPIQWERAVSTIERNKKGLITCVQTLSYSSEAPDKVTSKQVSTIEYDESDNITLSKSENYVLNVATGEYYLTYESSSRSEYDGDGNEIYAESVYGAYDEKGECLYGSKSSNTYSYEKGVMVSLESVSCDYDSEIKDYKEYSKSFEEYFENGDIKSYKSFSDGKLSIEQAYSIGSDGRSYLSQETTYYVWGGGKDVTEYNEIGEMTKYTSYDDAGSVISAYEYEYTYDSEGRLNACKTFDNGRLTEVNEYGYTADGERYDKKNYSYNEDGSYFVREYNERRDIVSEFEYAADGSVNQGYIYEYTYDTEGNIAHKKVYDHNGKLVEES